MAVQATRSYRVSRRTYLWFVLPALAATFAIIVFPWLFTLYVSLYDWESSGPAGFVGLANYTRLVTDGRFLLAIVRTLYYTILTVVAPLVLGTIAAVMLHREFRFRGLVRGIFLLPMMATPVAIALVWTMMFHPQFGVLNYLLERIGLPPSLWVYAPETVIPALAMVETWQWTPFTMLIVLGGLAAIPTDPYESATIDGASSWQLFRHITLPLVMPFIMIAGVLRTIDAFKAFDTIYPITQGGPGTASETINIYLYLQAFSYAHIGTSSAVVVVFFAMILVLAYVMVLLRQRSVWE
ncbi:MAG: sugar ABC transporter permease [Chloroflexota bacterium]|nr:sugar ABC transporter permease [Chloroflexota bacterium]